MADYQCDICGDKLSNQPSTPEYCNYCGAKKGPWKNFENNRIEYAHKRVNKARVTHTVSSKLKSIIVTLSIIIVVFFVLKFVYSLFEKSSHYKTSEQNHYILLKHVNLRENPSIDSRIIEKMKPLNRIDVGKIENNWIKINYHKKEGWMYNDHNLYSPIKELNLKINNSIYYANIRSGPSKNYQPIDTAKAGTFLEYLDIDNTNKWVKIRLGSKVGWIYINLLKY